MTHLSAPRTLPRSTPEEQGVPSSAVLGLVRRWEEAGLEPHSLAVVRHGHVVAEGWWAPYHRGGLQQVYSVSKTFTACAVGFAVDEGLLRLDERVVDVFPDAARSAGPRARRLTVHDLLAMGTGHRVDTLDWRVADRGGFPDHFLGTEPEEERGWFLYHNGATLMAALAVQQRTGERLLDYLRPRLLEPLGVTPALWSRLGGADSGYSGLHVTTTALTNLAQLLLRRGRWQGRQVLPEAWVEQMTARHSDTSHHPETVDWQQGYGYQLWHGRHATVRADGAFGQFAVIAPEADLALALTSCTERTQETLDAVWEELLPALVDGALPPDPSAVRALGTHLSTARLPAPASSGPAGSQGGRRWSWRHEPTEEVPALRTVSLHADKTGGHPVLTLVEGDQVLELPCPDGVWGPVDGPWVAAGGWSAPGVFEATVRAVETPHALHLRCADGRVRARWNAVPLTGPALAWLRAPAG